MTTNPLSVRESDKFASFVQRFPYTLCAASHYPPVVCPLDFKTCNNYKKAINEQQK